MLSSLRGASLLLLLTLTPVLLPLACSGVTPEAAHPEQACDGGVAAACKVLPGSKP
jgi:hypothetical protein